ncbi:MAG: substrate-binding domain-containing protein [Desulfobulbaceae bacterium]|nr:substrate-binding domain-containing protein [Desulfobulbaceae bacterium]
MQRLLISLFILTSLICFALPTLAASEQILKMATTTSTQASGLLDVLLPVFEQESGIRVKVIAKGTGAALRDGMDGNVDVIFVHAREREEQFVQQGYGVKRYAVMHNDFVILGSATDPAGIKGMDDGAKALKKIAVAKASFISRGDDSGTHTREQTLWQKTGVSLATQARTVISKGKKKEMQTVAPAGSGGWYFSIGQGMGKTLTFADEKQAYTLSDRGTYIKYKFGRKMPLDLHVLCEGDPALVNSYGLIPVNPKKFPHVRADLAEQFALWITSQKGQQVIADYRLLGKQLFYPEQL